MAEQWFYSAGGTKLGPVSSKELVALARSGKLRPTDLVWKDGLAEWKPAGRVKGLFPTTPTATAPPPLPTPTPGAAPSDLATAAKGLFGAAATAAQQAVTKATETAKQAQEALSAGTPPAPLLGRQKKGLLVVGSVVAVGVIVVAAAAVIAPLRGERGQSSNNTPERKGEDAEGVVPAAPAATVAGAEKQARAEAANLLPQVGELHYHVLRLQNLLAETRKSSGPICGALSELNQATVEGVRLDPKSGLYNFGTWYSQSAGEYDLDPTRVGRPLDAIAEAERDPKKQPHKDPVAAFIDIRTKLHAALRSVVGAKGAGIIDGDAAEVRKELANLRKKGLEKVEEPSPQFLTNRQAARDKAYRELKGNAVELARLKKMHADEDRLEVMTIAAERERVARNYEKRVKALEQEIRNVEQTATAKLNAGNQKLLAQTQKLLGLLDATKTAELERHWTAARKQYAVLMAATREMRERAERLRPTVPKDLGEQLEYIGGITHLVQGDLYYLEDKVIRIPDKYVSVFTTTRIDANKVAMMAHFRFKGNTTGKNGFGATIPVALYECDERHAEILLRQRDFEKQAGPYFALFRTVHNEPLENIQQTIRNLVGNEQYQAVLDAAEKRAAQDAVRDADAAAKPGGDQAGAVAPPVPPAAGVPKDAVPPAPARLPMPEPKAAVPAVPEPNPAVPLKPKLIPVYKVVFPGDVLLTTSEKEAKAIGKKYPGEFSGKAGHHVGTIGYAYAEKQADAVRFQRYLVPGTGRHAYWLGDSPNAGHKAEGAAIWVPSRGVEGATRRLVLFRKDAAGKTEYEYGTDKLAESFREKFGYQVGKDREFYLFDKAGGP